MKLTAPRATWLACLALGAVALPRAAQAEDEATKAPLVPYARDSIGGHVQLGVAGTLLTPFGKVSEDVSHLSRGGPGGGLLADLGIGLDRHVYLGAYGEMQWLGSATACESCSGTTLGAGLFVRYHFVQGMRFDPWASYGVGYRGLESESDTFEASYAGIEWMRLQLGATWFATPNFGFGPVIEFGAGTMISRPDNEQPGGTNYRLQAAFRVALDLPGR